jgi:hypothetical protein
MVITCLILLCFFQAKIQKHQAFEAEVAAHSNAIVVLDNTGMEMINQAHFASDIIRRRLGKFICIFIHFTGLVFHNFMLYFLLAV